VVTNVWGDGEGGEQMYDGERTGSRSITPNVTLNFRLKSRPHPSGTFEVPVQIENHGCGEVAHTHCSRKPGRAPYIRTKLVGQAPASGFDTHAP